MYVNKSERVTNPHRFTQSTCHTGDQPGPPSPYMGERRSNERMSSGTSEVPVGNAQKCCASELSNRKVNPIGGDGLIDAKWRDDKYEAESSHSRQRMGKCGSNQGNSEFDDGHRSGSVCQYIIIVYIMYIFVQCTVMQCCELALGSRLSDSYH